MASAWLEALYLKWVLIAVGILVVFLGVFLLGGRYLYKQYKKPKIVRKTKTAIATTVASNQPNMDPRNASTSTKNTDEELHDLQERLAQGYTHIPAYLSHA